MFEEVLTDKDISRQIPGDFLRVFCREPGGKIDREIQNDPNVTVEDWR